VKFSSSSIIFAVAGVSSALISVNALGIELNVAAMDSAWEKRAEICHQVLEVGKAKSQLPEDFEVLWRISRFAYYGGFFCMPENVGKEEKMDFFKRGVDAAEKARAKDSKRVEGHYWFASTYGGYALAKGVRASLAAAPLMRDAVTEAIKIDPSYHFGGPYRVRGRLYFALPSLISFGDNKLAYEDLKKAKDLGPTSKLNSIYFAEVQAKIENKAAALKTIEAAKNIPDVVGVKEDAAYRRDISRLEEKWK